MKIQSVEDLFLSGLQYVYDAEKQLTQALPQLAEAASTPQLREAFEQHLQDTKEHVGRAEEIFKRLGEQPRTKRNAVLERMREEAMETIQNTDKSEIRDAALIMAGNQVEHYEMAAYGSLRTFARLLGHNDVAEILQRTLDDEKKTDAKLTELGESQVNIQALHKSAVAGMAY
ncbi:MAG TPA: ferritin-like domain-containing protein [Bryobacteraceae bacterium]|jgi:ferritin-like metal-binding protein YciE|nr:ferritin-like domain-containing protein [Bryobacteraceae bacterium]